MKATTPRDELAGRPLRSRGEVLRRLASGGGLATVSGILTTRPSLIRWVDREMPEIAVITTKSYQRFANPGNREPILCEDRQGPEGTFGNAVGLRNPGMEAALRELAALGPLRALLNVSLAANTVEDFCVLARRLEPVADLFELNLSCPHATGGYGIAIGTDPAVVRNLCRAVRAATSRPFLAKLTPNTQDIGAIARAAVAGGADGIAAINTVGPFVYREPASGAPILGHPEGLGGRSGEGIRETAVRRVAEVRAAIGPGVPIIGMGGVSAGAHVRRLREAGADVVGVGSVLARVAPQGRLPAFVAALARDEAAGTAEAAAFVACGPVMAYRPFVVREARAAGGEVKVLLLEGRLDFEPSQYAFLFLPGAGEKPFSIAGGDPLTFVFRRRGPFTRALWEVGPGATVYVRGPCGAGAPAGGAARRAIVVAGGTGVAVAPPLVARLLESGCRVTFFYGVSREQEARLAALVPAGAERVVVADRGVPGRVVSEMASRLADEADVRDALCFDIGPPALMQRAAEAQEAAGVAAARILCSLETPSLCGVGVCGLCEAGGRLLCREGTFVSLEALRLAGGWTILADEAP